MNLARLIPILLATVAGAARAQTTLNPLSVVRLTTTTGNLTARIVSADSTSITVELPNGTGRSVARTDISAMQRRGGGALAGAKTLGLTGLALGALAGAVLVEGLCETSDCSDDLLVGMAMVGGFFGGVGALTGAFLGHATSWRPLGNDVRIRSLHPALSCLAHPRIEAQQKQITGILMRGHHQWSFGAICAKGTVIGVDFAQLERTTTFGETEVLDPVYGHVAVNNNVQVARYFRGVSVERPLIRGAMRYAAIAMLGEYRTDSSKAEYPFMKDYLPEVSPGFSKAYPLRNSGSNWRTLGAGVGAKASLTMGPQWTIGVASRLQQIGSSRQAVESGVTVSFRP